MPYLSKIALNPRRPTARFFLASPHTLHAVFLAGLAVQPVAQRVLWRMEENTPHRAEVLVLTESRPSWAHLVDNTGWPGADGGAPLIADYAPLLDRITPDQEFAFRLTANPVQNVQHGLRSPQPSKQQAARPNKTGDKSTWVRGTRVPHCTAAQQLQWLLRISERHGFTIPDAATPPLGPGLHHPDTGAQALTAGPAAAVVQRDTLRFDKAGHRVTLATATFEGRLRVSDPAALRRALLGGIGPAKAFGQGLLTLAPVRTSETTRHP